MPRELKNHISENIVADILGISKRNLSKFRDNLLVNERNKKGYIHINLLKDLPQFQKILNTNWDKEYKTKPDKDYKLVELFSGAGGLAIGMHKAGFDTVFLNDFDKDSCDTIQRNKNWRVKHDDISNLSFKRFKNDIDVLSGGFPCQAFSYAGKKGGFADTRGTLFFEFARAVSECKPKVILAENVKGLVSHDKGKTLETISNVINELGYDLVEPKVLKAIFYHF